MSTKNYAPVQEIFEKLISYWKLNSYRELAEHIHVPYQTLMAWKKRKSIGNYAPFMDKGISKTWLETGKGEMLQNKYRQVSQASQTIAVNEIQDDYPHLAARNNKPVVVTHVYMPPRSDQRELMEIYESLCEDQRETVLRVAKGLAVALPDKSPPREALDNDLQVKKSELK